MKLYVNNSDVTSSVSINQAIYESFSEDQADRIRIVFNDKDGTMSKYAINKGAIFRIKDDQLDSGVMYVKKAKPQNGQFEVIATSLPFSMVTKRTKEWKNTTLLNIMKSVAKTHSLTLKNYGVSDYTYKSVKQKEQSDIEFCNKILTYEGCKIIIRNKQMIIYSVKYIESQSAGTTINIGDDGRFEYFDNRFKTIGSLTNTYDKYTGKYVYSSSYSSSMQKSVTVDSNGMALRYAKGLIREANKNRLCGHFTREMVKGLAGASIISIKNSKSAMCDGKAFVYHVRHDLVNNSSKIFFRKPLNI